MGIYKYIREAWKKPKTSISELWRERLIKWRKEPVTVRVKRPTRLDRARSLGYKAKPGFVIVRQRVLRGGHERAHDMRGRRSKHSSYRVDLDKSYQRIAEERAAKKYVNCEVLNSYWVAKDGEHYWYEVILVDRTHPVILADNNINWISLERGRVYRGKTSSGRKTRGLRRKGKGAEKLRPSKTAYLKRK